MRHFLYRFFTGNYNILLILLFLLFVLRPYNYGEIYTGIWKTVLTGALITAIFNCSHRRSVKILISALAIPILLLSWINLLHQTPESFVAVALLTAFFMLICVGSIVYDVLLKARVTLETLRGVICAYFLAAFVFAYLYLLLEYLSPGTILIRGEILPVAPHPRYFSEMLYFSFSTLLTIGYGDIVAAKEWAQTVAVLEGVVGQFYIAILVARIVSVYSRLQDKQFLKALEKDIP